MWKNGVNLSSRFPENWRIHAVRSKNINHSWWMEGLAWQSVFSHGKEKLDSIWIVKMHFYVRFNVGLILLSSVWSRITLWIQEVNWPITYLLWQGNLMFWNSGKFFFPFLALQMARMSYFLLFHFNPMIVTLTKRLTAGNIN